MLLIIHDQCWSLHHIMNPRHPVYHRYHPVCWCRWPMLILMIMMILMCRVVCGCTWLTCIQDANVKILIFLEIELITNTLLILLGCIMMHRLNNNNLPTQSQHQLPSCSASMPGTLWASEQGTSEERPNLSTSASTCCQQCWLITV